MNAKMAELSARHKITLDCISKLIQSATFYPSRNWDDLYRRTERLRDLLNIAYDEAEELTIYALAETKPEPTKEVPAPAPTETSTETKENKTQVKHTPAKTSDARVQVIQMLKNGIPVKEIASKTGLKQYAIYKIRSEVM